MEEKYLFEFEHFDAKKILSNSFFANYGTVEDDGEPMQVYYEEDKTDDEILENFNCKNLSPEEGQPLQLTLRAIVCDLERYLEFILQLDNKLNEDTNKLATKIVDGEGDIETLKRRYDKLKELHQKYLKIPEAVGALQSKVNTLIDRNGKELEKVFRRQFAKNLKAARIKAGLTQQQLAYDAMITNADLSKFENGNKLPSLPTLDKIARALKVKIDDLLYKT